MVTQTSFRGRVPAYKGTRQSIQSLEHKAQHAFTNTVQVSVDDLQVALQYIRHLEDQLTGFTEILLINPEPKQESPRLRIDKSWRP